jgi:predicted nucleotidyltransferase component of viral defense system
MTDLNKHKILLVQILKDIYSDIELANNLGFKGGTALMLFYDLPRFSVDLDFNILDNKKSSKIFDKLRQIVKKYGKIKDEAEKHYGLLLVLDYGHNERNFKIEISNKLFGENYEVKNFLGINVKVMVLSDIFANKLSALLDRKTLTNRDIFDCCFLMQKRTAINKDIVEHRMGANLSEYLSKCIETIEKVPENKILSGLGDLMDSETKKWAQKSLKSEAISQFMIYKEFPNFL